MHILLEERKDLFLVQTDDGITTLPKNPYFILKLSRFDGNRIFHEFRGNARVEETYDDGIFNCFLDNESVQITDSQGIAEAVLQKDYDLFKKLFTDWFTIEQQKEIIAVFLKQHAARIKTVLIAGENNTAAGVSKHTIPFSSKQLHGKNDDIMIGYEIDGEFIVDAHGMAYYRKKDYLHSLCVVVQSALEPKSAEIPGMGTVTLNEITQIIIAKVLFFLYPRRDGVFMSQLPDALKRQVEHTIKNRKTGWSG